MWLRGPDPVFLPESLDMKAWVVVFYHLLFLTTTSTWAPSLFASLSVYVCISSTEPVYAEPSSYRAKVLLLLLLMCLITLCVDSILTSQQITCIYNVWAMQFQRPRLPCWSPVAELHCGTNGELADRQATHTGSSPSRKEPNVLCGL